MQTRNDNGIRQGCASTCTCELEFCRMGAAVATESTARRGGAVERPLPPLTPELAFVIDSMPLDPQRSTVRAGGEGGAVQG